MLLVCYSIVIVLPTIAIILLRYCSSIIRNIVLLHCSYNRVTVFWRGGAVRTKGGRAVNNRIRRTRESEESRAECEGGSQSLR